MIEQHVAVVHRSVAVLWPNVAYCDTRQWLVGFHVADLDDERLRAVVHEFF